MDAAHAYRELQRRARAERRGTEELLVLYAHEGFLRRLSMSSYRSQLILKGGMLLAVVDARRPTRDADLSVRGVPNDEASVRDAIARIAQISAADGLRFDTAKLSTKVMREDAEYQGVRVTIPTTLATAKIKVQIDLSFGDPVEVREISYPTLIDDQNISLLGYPVELMLAEKIATMMSRGQANTRDRDFADVALVSRIHTIHAQALRVALQRTADHRKQPVTKLAGVLDGHGTLRQAPWTALRQRAGLDQLSPNFHDVVAEVIAFVDPLVDGNTELGTWSPKTGGWSARDGD
jgi:predicted nucleotidyltransferase component of viral defense system